MGSGGYLKYYSLYEFSHLSIAGISVSPRSFRSKLYKQTDTSTASVEKAIFACGADFNGTYIRYVVALVKKAKPKVCFIPTAVHDDPYEFICWYEKKAKLNIRSSVLKNYFEFDSSQQTFEEQLADCNIIFVAGGSTLNMLAIWKEHSIDTLLRKAYDRGLILLKYLQDEYHLE